jgi:hypothetical protein
MDFDRMISVNQPFTRSELGCKRVMDESLQHDNRKTFAMTFGKTHRVGTTMIENLQTNRQTANEQARSEGRTDGQKEAAATIQLFETKRRSNQPRT